MRVIEWEFWITGAVKVEWDVRFAKFLNFLNFKEKEKSANENWHKSSLTSSLAKLLKILISLATPVLLLSIKPVSTNLSVNNSTIEAIHKHIYKKT